MPLYVYACQTCGKEAEELKPVDAPRQQPCDCGGTATKVPTAPTVLTFEPYFDGNAGRYFHTQQEKKAWMKKTNVEENQGWVRGGPTQRNAPPESRTGRRRRKTDGTHPRTT